MRQIVLIKNDFKSAKDLTASLYKNAEDDDESLAFTTNVMAGGALAIEISGDDRLVITARKVDL